MHPMFLTQENAVFRNYNSSIYIENGVAHVFWNTIEVIMARFLQNTSGQYFEVFMVKKLQWVEKYKFTKDNSHIIYLQYDFC